MSEKIPYESNNQPNERKEKNRNRCRTGPTCFDANVLTA